MSSFSNNNVYLKNIKNIVNLIKTEVNEMNENEKPKDNIYISIENAKKEWEDAKNIFDNVSDPDLIDYAIYNIDAAQKKYTYLLKQIRKSEAISNTN